MYFVVTLRLRNNAKKNVCIPMHWCRGFDMKQVFIGGVQKHKDLQVFFSKKRTQLPDFSKPIRDEFVDEDACYIACFRTCQGNID